jgi:hypothetical protein
VWLLFFFALAQKAKKKALSENAFTYLGVSRWKMSGNDNQCPESPKDDKWKNEQKLALYSKYFDLWTHSNDERTEYNKFFITLLFTDTLVAVLASLAGGKLASDAVAYTQGLTIIVFAAAGAISFMWMLKLQILNERDNEQLRVLNEMETCFCMPFHVTEQTKWGIKGEKLTDLLHSFVSPKDGQKPWRDAGHWLNYYGIASLIFVLSVLLCILAIIWARGILLPK